MKPWFTGVSAVALAASLSACGSSEDPPFPYLPHGQVSRTTTGAWGQLRDDPSFPAVCAAVDNRWNEAHAAPGTSAQQVFVEDLSGTPAFGWMWLWPIGTDVVTYPELVCGTKPWDMGSAGYTLGGQFPFQPDHVTLSVGYHAAMRSHGIHNVAFSLWAVSDTEHPLETLTNEIMIWVANRGQTPAGSLVGQVESSGATFDVWINRGQYDHSGGSSAVWNYAAFVARADKLEGPLDLTPLLDFLRNHGVDGEEASDQPALPDGAWIGDVELGTEVVGGAGLFEVTGFSLDFGTR